jgi:hypothetical protein
MKTYPELAMPDPSSAGVGRPKQHSQKADVMDKPFVAILLGLVLLLAVALWQFHSLKWG